MYFFNALAWTSTNPLALFVSGPVGMAAAAAVATGKKRKRPHIFESNPSIRKRQQTRLLRSATLLRLSRAPLCDPSSPTDIIYVARKYISSRLRTYRLACVCVCVFRKLRATLDEYTTRVGQQAIVLCISPSKPNPVFKVFGAAPLENVVSCVSRFNTLRDFGMQKAALSPPCHCRVHFILHWKFFAMKNKLSVCIWNGESIL